MRCAVLLQAVVQQALGRLMAGRTVLVIAHRLSTIRDANRICVISGGQLSEQGSHEELLSTKGIYAGLIARQLAASGSNGSSDGLEGGQPLSPGSFSSSRGAGGSLLDLSDGARVSLQEMTGRGSMSSSRSSTCRDRSSTETAVDAAAAAAAAAGEASGSQQQ